MQVLVSLKAKIYKDSVLHESNAELWAGTPRTSCYWDNLKFVILDSAFSSSEPEEIVSYFGCDSRCISAKL